MRTLVFGFAALLAPGTVGAAPELDAAIAQACAKLVACGCADDTCAAGFRELQGAPPAAIACLAGQSCPDLCNPGPDEMPPGVAVCFDDAKRAALGAAAPAAPATVAPAAPATAAVAASANPPRQQAIEQACAHLAKCGCPEASCVANFQGADALPTAALECVAGVGCAHLCQPNSGAAGSPVHDACFSPTALKRVEAEGKSRHVAAYCERLSACGCGEANCVPEHLKNTTNLDQDLFACLSPRPCETLCGAGALAEGSPSFLACVAPALQRKEARQALELSRMNSTHRMNMAIIRSMGGTGRTRVYDSNGNYLRTE